MLSLDIDAGEHARETLRKWLANEKGATRMLTATLLILIQGRESTDAIRVLREAIGSDKSAVVRQAIGALSALEERVSVVAGDIVGFVEANPRPPLGEADETILGSGCLWLWNLSMLQLLQQAGPLCRPTIKRIAALLERKGYDQPSLIGVVASQGDAAAPFVDSIAKLARDSSNLTRLAVAEAIGQIGVKSAIAIRTLRQLSGDPISSVRAAATKAISKLGSPTETDGG